MKSLILALALGTPVPEGRDDLQAFTAAKLRQYCKSCHGVGELRFIKSDDDAELWQYITTTQAPTAGKLWSEAIVDVLSWPSDEPPPFDHLRDPEHNKDWMPKGVKRLQLGADQVDGELSRHLILEALQGALP